MRSWHAWSSGNISTQAPRKPEVQRPSPLLRAWTIYRRTALVYPLALPSKTERDRKRPMGPRSTFHGSFWGNCTDVSEIMALAAHGKIRHTIKPITFDQLNENIELFRVGNIVGRAVMKF